MDSDDEWEEDEPGESLSGPEDEEEEEDKEDEDEDDGFYVPHGYLSEGEGCEDEEDDDVSVTSTLGQNSVIESICAKYANIYRN